MIWFFIFKDKKGILCSASQNTPIALKKEEQAIIFNFEVNVQQSIESISKGRTSNLSI